jgi:hypothetical protein
MPTGSYEQWNAREYIEVLDAALVEKLTFPPPPDRATADRSWDHLPLSTDPVETNSGSVTSATAHTVECAGCKGPLVPCESPPRAAPT